MAPNIQQQTGKSKRFEARRQTSVYKQKQNTHLQTDRLIGKVFHDILAQAMSLCVSYFVYFSRPTNAISQPRKTTLTQCACPLSSVRHFRCYVFFFLICFRTKSRTFLGGIGSGGSDPCCGWVAFKTEG